MKNHISFNEKYYPKQLDSIIGNKSQINQIKFWLNNFYANKKKILNDPKKRKKIKIELDGDANLTETAGEYNNDFSYGKTQNEHSCMILLGDHGVGKTCTMTAVLNSLKYDYQYINLTKIGSNKNIIENIGKLMNNSNILNHLNNDKFNNPAIIIDEVESANSPIEKNFILTLLKKNEEKWYCPIIFISNGKHSKTITLLKKNSIIVNFIQPNNNDLMLFFLKICNSEKIKCENENVANKIIEYAQKDYRRLLSLIEDLQSNYNNKITNDNVIEYLSLSKQKDFDIDIYKATANMIVNYKNIDECLRLYEGEKVIIPLVMHQNYIKCITDYHSMGSKLFNLSNYIAKSIAIGDVVENYIYSDQNWDMLEIHGFLTCVVPSFVLSNEKLKITEGQLKNMLKFPIDLNRTSIKKINKKNVVNSNICLKNFDIKDFIYANRLIRKLIDDGKLEKCAQLFDGYNVTIDNIESILKIDKINKTKQVISTQVKKKLSSLLLK